MKKIFVFIIIGFFMVFAVSCKKKEDVDIKVSLLSRGDIAPNFSLKDINGNIITLSANRGKVVMVEFWATWCSPCKEMAPMLAELYERYKDKGFVLLSVVSENEEKSEIISFMKKYKVTYHVLFAGKDIIRRYGIINIPVSFVINKDGTIVNKHLGAPPGILEELTTEIEELL